MYDGTSERADLLGECVHLASHHRNSAKIQFWIAHELSSDRGALGGGGGLNRGLSTH